MYNNLLNKKARLADWISTTPLRESKSRWPLPLGYSPNLWWRGADSELGRNPKERDFTVPGRLATSLPLLIKKKNLLFLPIKKNLMPA